MEIRKVADQLDCTPHAPREVGAPLPHAEREEYIHPALRLIAARPEVFYRQGHVAAGYRHRNGKTFGPYYRLSYRLDGRQYSVYLGRSAKLVGQVRKALGAIQKPLAQRRFFNQIERQIRASLRVQKLRMGALLRPYGLRLKGFEVRGWRYSPLRRFLPRQRRPLRRFLPRSRRWKPRISIRLPVPKFCKSAPPAARLLRFLAARDGPRAYDTNGDRLLHRAESRRRPQRRFRRPADGLRARLEGTRPMRSLVYRSWAFVPRPKTQAPRPNLRGWHDGTGPSTLQLLTPDL